MEKCNNPKHRRSKNTCKCLEHTMDKVDYLCKTRNIRLTPQRRNVIELMLHADKAMSAYDLLDQLKQIEPQAKPPTIYRALDFLMEHGFVHKVESLNNYILCPHFDDTKHVSILFICNHCHSIIEEHASSIEKELQRLADNHHFSTRHSILEIHGTCNRC